MKRCSKCKQILPYSEFTKTTRQKSGYYPSCKTCKHKTAKKTYDRYKVKYLEKEKLQGYTVDHTIPIQGKNVSGLHIITNMKYLTKAENLKKGNRYEVV